MYMARRTNVTLELRVAISPTYPLPACIEIYVPLKGIVEQMIIKHLIKYNHHRRYTCTCM